MLPRNQSLHALGLPQLKQAELLALLELQKATFVAVARAPAHQRRVTFAEVVQQLACGALACTLLCWLLQLSCASTTGHRLATKGI